MSLELVPVTFREAAEYVRRHHRHHRAPRGARAVVGATNGDGIVGVAFVGRPVSRHLDNGWTAEVTRLCTDGYPNAASFLYGAAARLARALGYRRCVTYTLASEDGTSLRAAGWKVLYEVEGRSWDRPGRPRVDSHPTVDKLAWEAP